MPINSYLCTQNQFMTMKQTRTAREMLAQIENDFFKGANLAAASRLRGEERRAFRLAQVERLLTATYGYAPLAMWLSDKFWTADEGRLKMNESNPLMTQEGLQTLTDEERERLLLMQEVAGLCHDLSLHFTFDLKEAFGIRNRLWVSNKRLVEWLSTTAYERIAMHTAYIMRKHAINVYASQHYLPAQDELAELFSREYLELVGRPDNTDIPPRDYVKEIINALLRIERHWQRGRRLKLHSEVVILHDEIYGVLPRQFDKGVLEAAQALHDYMDKEVYGRGSSRDLMGRFAEKVREVRAQYLAEGWVTDDSLAFGYLLSHAERCAYGYKCGEDEAL